MLVSVFVLDGLAGSAVIRRAEPMGVESRVTCPYMVILVIRGAEPSIWITVNPDEERVPAPNSHPHADIKLLLLNDQGMLNVFLDYTAVVERLG